MQWIDVDFLVPKHNKMVLIKIKEEIEEGYYDSDNDSFVLNKGKTIKNKGLKIYWAEIPSKK